MTQNVVQPMTLETDRGGAPTRGVMLDPSVQQDPKLRLEIGICGVTKPDGTEVLEVGYLTLRPKLSRVCQAWCDMDCSRSKLLPWQTCLMSVCLSVCLSVMLLHCNDVALCNAVLACHFQNCYSAPCTWSAFTRTSNHAKSVIWQISLDV